MPGAQWAGVGQSWVPAVGEGQEPGEVEGDQVPRGLHCGPIPTANLEDLE